MTCRKLSTTKVLDEKNWRRAVNLHQFEDQTHCTCLQPNNPEERSGHCKNYFDLADRIAELQYLNPQYVMMFRGQRSDRKDATDATTHRPNIFRGADLQVRDHILMPLFDRLREAKRLLVNAYERHQLERRNEIRRYRILRWSILQHYEVCATP